MVRFKFLLAVLVVTATVTIATFIPTEIHEYGLETKGGALSVYSESFHSRSWSSGAGPPVCMLIKLYWKKFQERK